jgi:hypothetical protein
MFGLGERVKSLIMANAFSDGRSNSLVIVKVVMLSPYRKGLNKKIG